MLQGPPQSDALCCDARDVFERHGLRCTRQRVEIYESLRASCEHPTAEELFSVVRKSQPGLSLATVYNTLEAFCVRGLCRKLPSVGAVARYDMDTANHVHLTTHSGEVRDVPADLGERLLESIPRELLDEVADRLGVDIRRVRIELLAAGEQHPLPPEPAEPLT